MNKELYILVSILLALLVISIVLIIKGNKQVKKDWETYNELEKQVKAVVHIQQANNLYIKIIKFQKNLCNSIIETRLGYLFAFFDGFLKAKENE